jgi:hypothetical protein
VTPCVYIRLCTKSLPCIRLQSGQLIVKGQVASALLAQPHYAQFLLRFGQMRRQQARLRIAATELAPSPSAPPAVQPHLSDYRTS